MPFVAPFERIAREDGILERGREDVIEILETRFEEVPNEIVEVINQTTNAALLKMLHKRAITINSLSDFQQVVNQLTSSGEQS